MNNYLTSFFFFLPLDTAVVWTLAVESKMVRDLPGPPIAFECSHALIYTVFCTTVQTNVLVAEPSVPPTARKGCKCGI